MGQDHFPLKLKIRIDWSEMDMFGHVNNVAYFKYIQAGRIHYWEKMGLPQFRAEMNESPILASTCCNFRQPLFYPDHVMVLTRIKFVKNTSFGIEHHVLNSAGEIAAEAEDVVVLFNFKTNEKIPIPDKLLKAMEKIEGKTLR